MPRCAAAYEDLTADGDHMSAAAALSGLSYCLYEVGDLDASAAHAARAVASARRLGPVNLEAYALYTLAKAGSGQERHREAVEAVGQAVAIVDAIGDPQRRRVIYQAFGDVRRAIGREPGAATAGRSNSPRPWTTRGPPGSRRRARRACDGETPPRPRGGVSRSGRQASRAAVILRTISATGGLG